MSQKLYLECSSGISGDMFVAAMLDLGADRAVLENALSSLKLSGFQTRITRVSKSGLDACDFHVILDTEYENHDHDMEYLHGEQSAPAEFQGHQHEYEHHEHRNLAEILTIINHAAMRDGAKKKAVHIFEILAQAEAKAHGVSIEQVHFHEVGAVDSIVDIVAAAVCLDNLGIQEVIVPSLQEGKGFVRCQHGMIPVPVPAVAAIAQEYGLVLHINDLEGEFVTPTGAAIVASIKTGDKLPDLFTIQKTGIGAGKREYERPSLLRAMLIQEETKPQEKKDIEADYIWKLESNIDDCTGENLGYVMQRLLDAGARDVNYIPAYMKKNRPAYQLNVICSEKEIEKLEEIIFMETTTIGIRRQKMQRSVLKRELKEISTSLGAASIKVCDLPLGRRVYPEYESVVKLAQKKKMTFRDVYQQIVRECDDRI